MNLDITFMIVVIVVGIGVLALLLIFGALVGLAWLLGAKGSKLAVYHREMEADHHV